MTRHWTINGRFLAQPITGVQRYAYEVVCALDRLLAEDPAKARDLEIELLLPPDAAIPVGLTAIRPRTVGRLSGQAWEQAVLPRLTPDGLISLCNTGPLSHRKQILCIHDVNTRVFPQSYSLPFRAFYRLLQPALGRRVHAVSTVSHHSKEELVRAGICPPEKLFVAPNGHEHATRWRAMHSPATRKAAGPNTIVVIGSTVPHKNTGLIIDMAERLAGVGLRVAVVGGGDRRVFRDAGRGTEADNVDWLGRLSDSELAALLHDCMCLAFPSFAEGFGLPPLEAMAMGCPVVVSGRTSLPEICGDAALYAPPDSADHWFERFVQLHGSPKLRLEMIARGRARTMRFRWHETAERYLQAMAAANGVATPRADERTVVQVA
ncbi:glycosyltransferase family 4 protein [Mesorhizobium xinjiangense]|uniref:glycosyltransferase family 4 protein n=1 Tax=Mesorhizobium xinjiangense TaxID=2678685 RepID=UPI0012ED84DE|nr:glycosyltransferase family 1 protein [Mesorhizobium xinjiangense]